MNRRALLLVAALGGCVELRTPPPLAVPAGLSPSGLGSVRSVIGAAAADFADRGAGLAGRPQRAALAAARLEWLADRVARDAALAPLGAGAAQELALARTELRDALGVEPEAASAPVVRALLAAARGDAETAAAALTAPPFRPGGAGSVARLGALGPLPQAALATQRTAEAQARLEAAGGANVAAPRTVDSFDRTTFGLGGVGPDGAAF